VGHYYRTFWYAERLATDAKNGVRGEIKGIKEGRKKDILHRERKIIT